MLSVFFSSLRMPNDGERVVNSYDPIFDFELVIALINEDFPALGNPINQYLQLA